MTISGSLANRAQTTDQKKKKRPPSTPRSRLQMSKGITRNEEWQIEWRSDFKVEESGKWEREKEKRLYCIN